MNKKMILALLSGVTLLSFQASADEVFDEQFTLNASKTVLNKDTSFDKFFGPYTFATNDPVVDCCNVLRAMCRSTTPKLTLGRNATGGIVAPGPIYVGGARYKINLSNLTPVYYSKYPGSCGYLVGYTTTFPVDGDWGQDLYFDLSGRSSKEMSVSAQCGSFSASDSGDKWVISRQQNTGGSCKDMTLKFKFLRGLPPTDFNFNVMISEEF